MNSAAVKRYLTACLNRDDSDQTAQLHNLIRVFPFRIYRLPISGNRKMSNKDSDQSELIGRPILVLTVHT